jgi:hypothetical protein
VNPAPRFKVVHESPDAAGSLYRSDQWTDQQSENENPGVTRICENIDYAIESFGDTGQRIELVQESMTHPDTREERQDDLLAPDGEDDRENWRKD